MNGKKMKNGTRVMGKTIRFVAMASVLAIAMAGCARGSTTDSGAELSSPGLTDKTITLGVSIPLSGPAGGPGSCALGGLESYFAAANEAGGIEFGDGVTRTVEIKSYDDAWDPAKAVSNFRQQIADGVFATVGSLGTGNNLAVMPLANSEKVPQVFMIAGSSKFSADQEANPWTIGWFPSYEGEGFAFGKMLAEAQRPLTVAVLSQNDDVGQSYVAGLERGIKGSQIEIIERATYESTDPTVDAQMTKLAASNADVFFSANSITSLTVASLLKAQQLGWLPDVFLTSVANSKKTVIDPAAGEAFPGIYSTSFSKSPSDPQYADDEDVIKFYKDMNAHSPELIENMVPHCVWGYQMAATLEAAFKGMTTPTREGLMEAVHGIRDLEVPLMLPGILVDASSKTQPPVDTVRVEKFSGGAYAPAESFNG